MVVLLASIGQPSARAEGWKLPTWNPFSSDSSKPKNATKSWSIPMLDGKPLRSPATLARRKSPGPSTWDRFQAGTKKFFVASYDTVTLKKLRAPKKPPSNQPPWANWNPGAASSSSQSAASSGSRWSPTSWFQREPPSQPRTITEFVAMPRVNE